MASFTNAGDLARVQRARAQAARTRIRTAHARMANELYEEADKSLSGHVTTAAQKAMGHPYGRGVTKAGTPGRQRRIKGSKARLPAMPINTQTGRLRQALKLYRRGGDEQIYSLQINKAAVRYARFILSPDGTRKMVTRPFWAENQKRWRKRNFDLLVAERANQRKT